MVGGPGGDNFKDRVPAGSHLGGFRITLGFLGPNRVVKSMQPIFVSADGKRIDKGELHGQENGEIIAIQAPAGYAVAGLSLKAGDRIDGFKAIYMRIQGDRLNSKDRKESEWHGGKGGGPEKTIAGTGQQITSFTGRAAADLRAVGFVLRDDKESVAKKNPAKGSWKNLPARFFFANRPMQTGELLEPPGKRITGRVLNMERTWQAAEVQAIQVHSEIWFLEPKTGKHHFFSNQEYANHLNRLQSEGLQRMLANNAKNDPFSSFIERLAASDVGKQMIAGFVENLSDAVKMAWDNPGAIEPIQTKPAASAKPKAAPAEKPAVKTAAKPEPASAKRFVVTGRIPGVKAGTPVYWTTVPLFPGPWDSVYADERGRFSITISGPGHLSIRARDRSYLDGRKIESSIDLGDLGPR